MESHLLQMRGLKPKIPYAYEMNARSHLLQMRGLKPDLIQLLLQFVRRIFYRCVDWNTVSLVKISTRLRVASFTDAWIETSHWSVVNSVKESHLLQMRGLKLRTAPPSRRHQSRIFYRCVDWNSKERNIMKLRKVASFTDAWIETKENSFCFRIKRSHLLQMRGLKPNFFANSFKQWLSHLLQMRGLKLRLSTGL